MVRPCRHVLCGSLFKDWTAHLCGLCLTLRSRHGQAARLVTNYDGLLVSVLVEAQAPEASPRRTAGPCALRGLRRAEIVAARAEGAQLAAATSLLLAAGRTRDHVADGDGAYARRAVAAAAGRLAGRWDAAGGRTGAAVGFDAAALRDAVARQPLLEATPGLGPLELTEPTETAVAAVFAHTAVLAGREGNAEPLAEAGRFFGRLAHLIDAVEDVGDDIESGAYNPLVATGTGPAEARRLAADALRGLRLALAELELEQPALVRALLDREVARSVDRVFAAYPPAPGGPPPHGGPYPPHHGHPQRPHAPYPQQGYPQHAGGGHGGGGGFGGWGGGGHGGGHGGGPRRKRPPLPIPCFTGSLVCATCGIYQPEWSKYHGRRFSDRFWVTRHCDDCGCDGNCDCCCCPCD
ncbi:DUF5685 family protein [Actinomadura sp. WMMB 499]|uniref:DUF5685 family protein n=1 Tax=Actinomadura sp. WMMB 499 TaxID=1219491 RepID=UPI0020C7BC86|nr:DUF5685 family protein [Actinomadura sp. WMMB 499]